MWILKESVLHREETARAKALKWVQTWVLMNEMRVAPVQGPNGQNARGRQTVKGFLCKTHVFYS